MVVAVVVVVVAMLAISVQGHGEVAKRKRLGDYDKAERQVKRNLLEQR